MHQICFAEKIKNIFATFKVIKFIRKCLKCKSASRSHLILRLSEQNAGPKPFYTPYTVVYFFYYHCSFINID